jgi:hypothetical protein
VTSARNAGFTTSKLSFDCTSLPAMRTKPQREAKTTAIAQLSPKGAWMLSGMLDARYQSQAVAEHLIGSYRAAAWRLSI